MAITHEGAQARLKALISASEGTKKAREFIVYYENEWGAEGFIHSISELIAAAHTALETSRAILQDYMKEIKPRGHKEEGETTDDDGFGNQVFGRVPAIEEPVPAVRFR